MTKANAETRPIHQLPTTNYQIHAPKGALDFRQQLFLQRGFRHEADDLVHELSAFEEEHGRDGAHAVFGGDGAVFIHVDLCDGHLAIQLGGELLEDRRDRFAGPAPGRPKIDEDRRSGGRDGVLESAVGEVGDFIGNNDDLTL